MSTDAQTELLDPTPEQQIISSYGIAVEELKSDVERAKTITVEGPEDKAGMKLAHDMRIGFKRTRITVENKRKELKADVLARGRLIDQAAKDLVAIFADEESRLQELEDTARRHQEQLEREAEQARQAEMKRRCDELAKYGAMVPTNELEAMDDARFDEVLAEKKLLHEAKLKQAEEEAAARKAEEERLERDRAEQQKREAEIQRREREIAAREAEASRKEQEARYQLGKQRLEAMKAIGCESHTSDMLASMTHEGFGNLLNTEQIRVAERKHREEKLAAEAEERRKQEAADAEARAERLRPDKEKIHKFILDLNAVPRPGLSADAADAAEQIAEAVNDCLTRLEAIHASL